MCLARVIPIHSRCVCGLVASVNSLESSGPNLGFLQCVFVISLNTSVCVCESVCVWGVCV